MSRRLAGLLAACLLPGCVPVTEPLSDAAKAEPDKRLLGDWKKESGILGADELRIDAPAVKGNPKGLLRTSDGTWFYTTTIGKDTYANFLLDTDAGTGVLSLDREGAFEAWRKGKGRGYFIFRYAVTDDTLVIDGGNEPAFRRLAEAEKLERTDRGVVPLVKTPEGWLATHLEKHGPKGLFPGNEVVTYKRLKKK